MIRKALSASQGISLCWWGCYFSRSFIVSDTLTLSLLTDSSQVLTYQHAFQNQQGTHFQYKGVGVGRKLVIREEIHNNASCTILGFSGKILQRDSL